MADWTGGQQKLFEANPICLLLIGSVEVDLSFCGLVVKDGAPGPLEIFRLAAVFTEAQSPTVISIVRRTVGGRACDTETYSCSEENCITVGFLVLTVSLH